MNFISSGVTIKAGKYVGHNGVENSPTNAITTIEIKLIDPPHLDGSIQTIVAHVTSGASVSIKIVQIMVRFIKIQGTELAVFQ